ncbi:hypothetical protein D3C73_1055850 [compost metagenome]
MIAFKLGILPAFASYGIVVIFMPNTKLLTFQPVFPNAVRSSSQPFHSGNFFFRVIESDAHKAHIALLAILIFQFNRLTGSKSPFYMQSSIAGVIGLNNILAFNRLMRKLLELGIYPSQNRPAR